VDYTLSQSLKVLGKITHRKGLRRGKIVHRKSVHPFVHEKGPRNTTLAATKWNALPHITRLCTVQISHRSVLSCQLKVSEPSCKICIVVCVCVCVCACARIYEYLFVELKVISLPMRSKIFKTCLKFDIARCSTKMLKTLIERHDQPLFIRNFSS
jgi:hypothetical protein